MSAIELPPSVPASAVQKMADLFLRYSQEWQAAADDASHTQSNREHAGGRSQAYEIAAYQLRVLIGEHT